MCVLYRHRMPRRRLIPPFQPVFVQNLHALLVQFTSNDTVQLKQVSNRPSDLPLARVADALDDQATTTLNREFYQNAQCIPALASIIASSPEQGVSFIRYLVSNHRSISSCGEAVRMDR